MGLPTPITRKETFLNAAAGGSTSGDLPTPITREEEYLKAIAEGGGGSGGGEVKGVKGDAESTYRKGNVNLTPANLGLANVKNIGDGLALDASTGTLSATGMSVTIDDHIDSTSVNPVQNKVIADALDDKADSADLATVATSGDYDDLSNKPDIPDAQVNSDWTAASGVAAILHKPTLGTAAAKDSTNAVTAGSTDLVESGAVKTAIDAAVASAYHHAGTKTVAELVAALLIADNDGNVYNITDSGETTADFIEGAGHPIKAGDNVGVAKVGSAYKFDLLSGFVDTSGFVQKSQTAGLLKNDGTVDTTQYISQHQDISGKADKVSGGTANNFAALDANGNLKDSGHKHSDYLTAHQDISGKADKVSSATNGHLAGLNSSGNLTDSGIASGIFPSGVSTSNKLATMSDVSGSLGTKLTSTVSNDTLTFTSASITSSKIIDGPYIQGVLIGILELDDSTTGTLVYTLEDDSANGATAYIWVRS